MTISAFSIVATIPILAPAFRFDSFNPFNDTFTYLVHGQWLQEHAFHEVARASGFFPSETQVVLYQTAGQRMGASFLLGFVQSMFHLEWSYYAYLVTVGLAFTIGSLAIGGVIQQVNPVSKLNTLTLCTLPAFTMNGFVFGAQYGFFPQTFGLAFVAGLVCLTPAHIAHTLSAKPNWFKQFIYLIPLALSCSALLIVYNDIFPMVGAGIGVFLILVVVWIYWKDKYPIIVSVLILLTQVMLVVNVEGVRILRTFIANLTVASGTIEIGWPVPWSPIQFIAHSFGLKSPFNSNVFLVDRLISTWMLPIVLIIMIYIIIRILREKPRNLTVLLMICINAVFWLAFLKFRYATAGLEGQVGHTFLQYKTTKWLAPINIGLLGISLAWLINKSGWYKRLVIISLAIVILAGTAIQLRIVAEMFTQHFQDETMRKYSPFNVLLDLRSRVSAIPKDEVIYLGIPHDHHKLTQMVAYVLYDRKLAGKYMDGYLRGHLPASERELPIEVADWIIRFKPTQTVDENPLDRVGPFLIHHAPFAFYNLESVSEAYGTETGDKKKWNWVKEVAEYKFKHIGTTSGATSKSRVSFEYLVSGNPRTLRVAVNTMHGKQVAAFDIPMTGGWGKYSSPAINTDSEDLTIRFSADGAPVRLSDRDAREAKFLIQNLNLAEN